MQQQGHSIISSLICTPWHHRQDHPIGIPSVLPTTQRQKKHWGQKTEFFSPLASVLRPVRVPQSDPDGPRVSSLGIHSEIASPSTAVDVESLAAHLSRHFNSCAQGLAYVAVPVKGFINFRSAGHSDGTIFAADAKISDRKRPCSKLHDAALRKSNLECQDHDNCEGEKQVQIVTVPAAFDEESFELYKRYQVGGSFPPLVMPSAF